MCNSVFTSAVAQRVLRHKPLKLESATLEVKPLLPLPPPPMIQGLTESELLLMTGLPPEADAEMVTAFVEPAAQCRLRDIVFSTQPGIAMLKFHGMPGGLVMEFVQGFRAPLLNGIFSFAGSIHLQSLCHNPSVGVRWLVCSSVCPFVC